MLKKLLFLFIVTLVNTQAYSLPNGFVYLEEIDPTIKYNLGFLTEENFTGKKISFSKDKRVILTTKTAEKLKEAQSFFKNDGFNIVVYNGYLPDKVFKGFKEWSDNKSDQKMKKLYFPRIDKDKLYDLNYLLLNSPHSRGSTVDLSIILFDKELHKFNQERRKLTDSFEIIYLDDGSIDMGTSVGFFDKSSYSKSNLITNEQQKNRDYLIAVMELFGFKNSPIKWWEFTLKEEPFPEKYFDFDID